MKLNNVFCIDDATYHEWSAGEHYSGFSSGIAGEMGAKLLGFHLEKLSPKNFSCPYHFHHAEEELFLVLRGSAILRQNDQYQEVSTGDLIYFGIGPEYSHQFYNHTEEEFLYLAISNKDERDIAEYPDSNKIYIRKNKKMFENKNNVPYITGEENPKKYWKDKL